MAVIQAKIRYFAFYASVNEMKQDENVRENFLVTVITNQICTDYQVKSAAGLNAVKLNNGLYANPIYSGNSLSATVSQIFSTSRPIEFPVGGVTQGDEFQSVTLVEVLNKMFYGTSRIEYSIKDNLLNEIHVRGEIHVLNTVTVTIDRTEQDVVSEELYINGILLQSIEETWNVGDHVITIKEGYNMTETSVISIILRDVDGNAVEKKITEVFKYPIFYNVVSVGAEPNWITVKNTFPHVKDHSDLSLTVTLSGTSAYIAIPTDEVSLLSVLDENNFNVKDIYSSWNMVMTIGATDVSYKCYRTPGLTVEDFVLTYKFKEVQ